MIVPMFDQCDNEAVRNFFIKLEDELNRSNRDDGTDFDIPFLMAIVTQQLTQMNPSESLFIRDLEQFRGNCCITPYKPVGDEYYNALCKIVVDFYYEDSTGIDNIPEYEFIFSFEDRYIGYCGCSQEDEGYIAEKDCCGYNCDWSAPALEINKIVSVSHGSWKGLQCDYWGFEKAYYERNQKAKNDKQIKDYNDELSRLKNIIKNSHARIRELNESLKELGV